MEDKRHLNNKNKTLGFCFVLSSVCIIFANKKEEMNVKELMNAVDFDDVKVELEKMPINDIDVYRGTYETLRDVKPTFGYFDNIIEVSRDADGHLLVTNTHLGSVSDLAGHRFDSASDISAEETAAAIVYQITAHSYETERYKDHLDDDWYDDDDLNP